MKKIYIAIAILIVGVLVVSFLPRKSNAPTSKEAPAITTESPETSGSITISVGEKGQVGDLGILLKGPIQDSRCPAGVQCIWAGEVRSSIVLSTPTKSETISIANNKPPYVFEGRQISMVAISPSSKTPNQTITQAEYKITFQVEPIAR